MAWLMYNTEPGEERLDIVPTFLPRVFPDIDTRLLKKVEMLVFRIVMIMESTDKLDIGERLEDEPTLEG